MEWLAYYYIVFFAIGYLLRNHAEEWAEHAGDGFIDWFDERISREWLANLLSAAAKLLSLVLLLIAHLSFWSYVLILYLAVITQFFGPLKDLQSGFLTKHIFMLIFALPTLVIGKIVYERGYKKGIEEERVAQEYQQRSITRPRA
jgi:hypothetical protein